MIVIDASAVIDALTGSGTARDRLDGADLHAPHLLDLEVASGLRRLAAGGRVTDDDARRALSVVARSDIHRYPHMPLLGPIWASRHSVTPYDGAYVALALALDAPLVTSDRNLAATPELPCEVELV